MKNKLRLSRNGSWMLLFLVLFSLNLRAQAAAKQPNVVFIFIDDQGFYDLSCYGAKVVKTPRIDALAKNGTRFTDFYSAAPICSPSRAGVVTGSYPRRTGNEVWVHRPDSEEGLPASITTMGELFKDAGYATCCIGKWHLGFKEKYMPWNNGYDHYYGIMHNLDSYEVAHYDKDGGMPFMMDKEVIRRNVPPEELTRLYTDEAISWIEKKTNEEKPFLLYLPHTMLHKPLGVSPEFKGTSNWKAKQDYGDAIQEMDYHVGRIVDALDRLKISNDTIVVYTSDNGRYPGRNKKQPIRGSKLTCFEGGFRVPAIISAPGQGVKPGLETSVVAHAMDWYPTLASLAGIEIPKDLILDGRDLSALLKGETTGIPAFDKKVSLNAEVPLRRPFFLDEEWNEMFTQEEYLNAFFYHGSQGALAAVRSGKWKLTLHPNLNLYDLEKDLGEKKSIADWKIRTKLRGMVIRFQREMNNTLHKY